MSDKILKLSQAQTLYQDLRERINALPTDSDIPTVPVQDVQINSTSIITNGTANIPIAGASLGVIKIPNTNGGLQIFTSGTIAIAGAGPQSVKDGVTAYNPIVPSMQHQATFYGLAKAAGADMKDIANTTVGTYPNAQKAAIQSMLGISNLLAPIETTIASKAYNIGEVFTSNGKLYKATTSIAAADTIVVQNEGETVSEHNAEECKVTDYAVHDVQVNGTSILNNGVASIPILTGNNMYGLVKINANDATEGLVYVNGLLTTFPATSPIIKVAGSSFRPITPTYQHESTFYGLAKAAGDSTQSASSNTVGTYTTAAATAIKTMLQVQEGLEVVRLI